MMQKCLYIVMVEIAPEAADRLTEWYETVHIPEVLREPGFLRARRWRDTVSASDGWVRFFTHYELDSVESYQKYNQSAAAKALREDYMGKFGSVSRLQRQVLEEIRTIEI